MTLAQDKILSVILCGSATAVSEDKSRRIMRLEKAMLAAGLVLVLGAAIVTGCETGRNNKLHSGYEYASDVTTVPHPNPEYASVSTGIPTVPGSPTAAGPDGMQPRNDNQGRVSPGSEEGIPMAPRMQPQDRFLHQ